MEIEQMMACLLAEMMAILKAGHKEIIAKMDSHHEELMAIIKASQERMQA
jgi:hypothetical protein